MTQANVFIISGGAKCTVLYDTYLYVRLNLRRSVGEFIGKVSGGGIEGGREIRSGVLTFEIFAMDEVFGSDYYSKVLGGTARTVSLLIPMSSVEDLREIVPEDVPLIINWWICDKYKQEVFGI
jgi:hypothetical protein